MDFTVPSLVSDAANALAAGIYVTAASGFWAYSKWCKHLDKRSTDEAAADTDVEVNVR